MTGRRIGLALLVLGALLMAATVLLGKMFMPELQGPDARPLSQLQGTGFMLRMLLFGLGFPLGLGLALAGAALFGEAGARRGLLLLAAAGLAVGLTMLVPGVFGRHHSPLFFGVGGVSILVLYLGAMWHWSRWRRALEGAARGGADLLGLGYLCFAIAAWNICGSGGLPGFALYPERVLALGTVELATGQLKVVMAFLLLGWLLTLLGLRRSAR
jgi:hypothetical protein